MQREPELIKLCIKLYNMGKPYRGMRPQLRKAFPHVEVTRNMVSGYISRARAAGLITKHGHAYARPKVIREPPKITLPYVRCLQPGWRIP